MRTQTTATLLAVCLLFFSASSGLAESGSTGAGRNMRAGPAEKPHSFRDYGGTPDITITREMGLSSDEVVHLLARLKSTDQAERTRAADELERNASGSEDALRLALWENHGARNTAMRHAIQTARRRAEATGKKGDLTAALVAVDPSHPELGKGTIGALRVLCMLRALNSLNTLAAFKVMIEFSPRHAGVFRHEIGRMLVAHGLDVLPALIYSRGSDDREIHMFSVKWIRDMGNPLLSQQVKIKNPRRLAQLLEAYASVNDLDVIDVTLSLTNHNSVFVRNAARRCLASFGRNAKWPARRLYENTFSREPTAATEVEDILEELYTYFDTQRLIPMTAMFESGLAAYRDGNLQQMERAFQKVLGSEPMFPRRNEMAPGFLALARALEEKGESAAARERLRTLLRIADPASDESRLAAARLKWIQAEQLRELGVADPELYRQVLEDDPENDAARAWFEQLTGQESSSGQIVTKALVVSFIVFLAASLVFLRLRA